MHKFAKILPRGVIIRLGRINLLLEGSEIEQPLSLNYLSLPSVSCFFEINSLVVAGSGVSVFS